MCIFTFSEKRQGEGLPAHVTRACLSTGAVTETPGQGPKTAETGGHVPETGEGHREDGGRAAEIAQGKEQR